MAQYTTMSKSAIQYLCSCINQLASVSEAINNTNLADDKVFSNLYTKKLIDKCLEDANTEAQKLVGALTHLTCEETTVQPTLDNSTVNVIYLYSATGTAPYQQYLKISDTKLIDLGSTSISLSDYLTATQIASTYAKQVDLNTLTDEVNAIKDTIGTETLTTTSTTLKGAINEVAESCGNIVISSQILTPLFSEQSGNKVVLYKMGKLRMISPTLVFPSSRPVMTYFDAYQLPEDSYPPRKMNCLMNADEGVGVDLVIEESGKIQMRYRGNANYVWIPSIVWVVN